jgi:hypothetical protein
MRAILLLLAALLGSPAEPANIATGAIRRIDDAYAEQLERLLQCSALNMLLRLPRHISTYK